MANVGSADSGMVYQGQGSGRSGTFLAIGTNSGLTAHGPVIAQGAGAFKAAGPGISGQVLTSNGPSLDPTFQTISTTGAVTTITGNSGGAQTPSLGNFNILGTGSITIAGSANTETVQLTGLTNHNVLVGAGTATITNIAPSATSGVPLISQGASSDPAFGTVVVAGGGTGATTLTNHGVLLGQATSAIVATSAGTTGQVLGSNGASADPSFSSLGVNSGLTNHGVVLAQNNSAFVATGAGTAGQVLTSNGASADPTFQAVSVPSYSTNLVMVDDFLCVSGSFGPIGAYAWGANSSAANSFVPVASTSSAHPGVVGNFALSASPSVASMFLGNTSTAPQLSFVLGGGAITMNFVVNLATLSNGTNRYTLRLGFGDTQGGDQVNGVYFEYSDNINSGNWNVKTASASSRTTTNSATAATTGWHNFQITVNAASSSTTLTLDGVALGTITTNIPSAAVTPFIDMVRSAGTIAASTVLVDVFSLNQALTVAR